MVSIIDFLLIVYVWLFMFSDAVEFRMFVQDLQAEFYNVIKEERILVLGNTLLFWTFFISLSTIFLTHPLPSPFILLVLAIMINIPVLSSPSS